MDWTVRKKHWALVLCACVGLGSAGCVSKGSQDAGEPGGGGGSQGGGGADGGGDGGNPADAGGQDGGTPSDAGLDAGEVDGGFVLVENLVVASTLEGIVVNADDDLAIAGASVQVGAAGPVATDADGGFAVAASIGRPRVTVTAQGYLPWSQEVPLVFFTENVTVRMVPRATDEVVSAAQDTTLYPGPATLQFLAGTYGSDTQVSATWLGVDRVASFPGPALFQPGDAGSFALSGVLAVEAAEQPLFPVDLTVPLPGGVSGDAMRLFELDGGTWTNPRAPDSFDFASATFALTHFSYYGLGSEASFVCWVESVQNTVEVRAAPGDPWQPLAAGDTLGTGASIRTGNDATAEIRLDDGTELLVKPGTSFTVGETGSVREVFLGAGRIRALVAKLRSRTPRFRTSTSVAAVRGTVLDVRARTCTQPKGGSADVSDVLVAEGQVDLTVGQNPATALGGGTGAQACPGCATAVSRNVSGHWVGTLNAHISAGSVCPEQVNTHVWTLDVDQCGASVDGWSDTDGMRAYFLGSVSANTVVLTNDQCPLPATPTVTCTLTGLHSATCTFSGTACQVCPIALPDGGTDQYLEVGTASGSGTLTRLGL